MELEADQAREMAGVRSQYGLEAARIEEDMHRGRLDDLASALRGEIGRVGGEMDRMHQAQAYADSLYRQHLADTRSAYFQPQLMADEGLRLMLGGIGSTLDANAAIGPAMSALSNAGAAYGEMATDRAGDVSAIGQGLLDALFKKES